jgi:hypothetical protein
MTTVLTKRNIALGLALTVTIGLVVLVNGQDQEGGLELAKPDHGKSQATYQATHERKRPEADVTGISTSQRTTSQPRLTLDMTLLSGREPADDTHVTTIDLFKLHSWYVAPPPKPAGPPPSPPKPVAPAVPFSYMGRIDGTPDGTLLMLSGGNRVYTVAVGETIEKVWRLDSDAGKTLRFTYLPLELPQTLSKSVSPASAKPDAGNQNETEGIPL